MKSYFTVVRRLSGLMACSVLIFLASCATPDTTASGFKTYKCYEGPERSPETVAIILNQRWGYTWLNFYDGETRLNAQPDITVAAAIEVAPGKVNLVAKSNFYMMRWRQVNLAAPLQLRFHAEPATSIFLKPF